MGRSLAKGSPSITKYKNIKGRSLLVQKLEPTEYSNLARISTELDSRKDSSTMQLKQRL